MKPVVWGVIGISGHFVKNVLLPTRTSPKLCIRAIASRSADRAREAAERYGIPHSYGSYEELLADEAIEAIYNPLPNHLHLEWIKRSADAGKHILCEKPLCLTAEEVREALEYTSAKGVLLMEAFMYRFHPQWVRARELVQTGAVGRPVGVQASFAYNNPDPTNIRNIREVGGGGLYDIGCYAVSSARFLLGREPRRAIATMQRDPDSGIDRLTSGMLDFGEAQAVFTVGTQNAAHQHVTLFATGGHITIPIPFNTPPDVPARMSVTTSLGTRELSFDPVDQYGLQFEAFSNAVRTGGEAPIDPQDALANQQVLDALFASEESARWEDV